MFDISQPVITPRLTLQIIQPDDNLFVLEILNSPGWIQFIGDRKVRNSDDAAAYINKIITTTDLYYWVAKITTTQQPIGIISYIKRNYLDHYDLGFALLPQFQSQGYAFEAANSILQKAKNDSPSSKILATLLPTNTSSINLLTRLGFQFEQSMDVDGELLHVYAV